ncbi:MAG: FYDLN acid domain-containing protein [Proteobacteria bacterium]|nr:FYDLN acid domain-containing protein [Pseudomonadota bacterium]
MAKAEWGEKRQCPKCGTRFYDIGQFEPIVCISCDCRFKPEIILKSKTHSMELISEKEKAKDVDVDDDDDDAEDLLDDDALLVDDDDDDDLDIEADDNTVVLSDDDDNNVAAVVDKPIVKPIIHD